jgi:hypothetical protein
MQDHTVRAKESSWSPDCTPKLQISYLENLGTVKSIAKQSSISNTIVFVMLQDKR